MDTKLIKERAPGSLKELSVFLDMPTIEILGILRSHGLSLERDQEGNIAFDLDLVLDSIISSKKEQAQSQRVTQSAFIRAVVDESLDRMRNLLKENASQINEFRSEQINRIHDAMNLVFSELKNQAIVVQALSRSVARFEAIQSSLYEHSASIASLSSDLNKKTKQPQDALTSISLLSEKSTLNEDNNDTENSSLTSSINPSSKNINLSSDKGLAKAALNTDAPSTTRAKNKQKESTLQISEDLKAILMMTSDDIRSDKERILKRIKPILKESSSIIHDFPVIEDFFSDIVMIEEWLLHKSEDASALLPLAYLHCLSEGLYDRSFEDFQSMFPDV
jgi:hypothetical protein